MGNAWWMSALSTLLTPLATSEKVRNHSDFYNPPPLLNLTSLTCVFRQDCGGWMARAVLDPSFAKGAHHLDNHADPVPSKKLHITPEAQKTLYDHFMEEVGKY